MQAVRRRGVLTRPRPVRGRRYSHGGFGIAVGVLRGRDIARLPNTKAWLPCDGKKIMAWRPILGITNVDEKGNAAALALVAHQRVHWRVEHRASVLDAACHDVLTR